MGGDVKTSRPFFIVYFQSVGRDARDVRVDFKL
jgi:hypothetical protein